MSADLERGGPPATLPAGPPRPCAGAAREAGSEPITQLVRFASAAMGAAIARRRAKLHGAPFSADAEVDELTAALAHYCASARGLDPEGEAVRQRDALEAVLDDRSGLGAVERALRLEGAARGALRLLVAHALEPRIATLFGHVHESLQATRPTQGALADVLRDPLGVAVALAPGARLVDEAVVTADRFGPDALLSIDPRVVAFVASGRFCPLVAPHGRVEEEAIEPVEEQHLAWAAEHAGCSVAVLRGARGAGRTRAARALAQREGRPLLHVTLASLGPEADALVRVALRDARILGARVLVTGALGPGPLELLSRAEDVPIALAIDENAAIPLALLDRRVVVADLAIPTASERRALWADLLARPVDDPELARVAERYAFSPGTIRRAARQAVGRPLDEACRLQLSTSLDGLRVHRAQSVGWARLVLPAQAMDALRAIVAQYEHRTKVEEVWGFGAHHRLGRGVKALFFGRPGTGKTLAAEIVAAELGLPLLRIDVARVVSKWVGETEQNLARLFDEAKQANAILFFDEADSLFTKRTGVSSATDRYANMEVSYLLQRVEEHEGVLILATNVKANLDQAFARRLHFSIEFPEPDVRARESIWRLSLPPSAPLASTVSFTELARRFEISGGAIKNVVVGAAYLAAEEGKSIDNVHIAAAMRREYAKMDRLYQRGEIDALAARS